MPKLLSEQLIIEGKGTFNRFTQQVESFQELEHDIQKRIEELKDRVKQTSSEDDEEQTKTLHKQLANWEDYLVHLHHHMEAAETIRKRLAHLLDIEAEDKGSA